MASRAGQGGAGSSALELLRVDLGLVFSSDPEIGLGTGSGLGLPQPESDLFVNHSSKINLLEVMRVLDIELDVPEGSALRVSLLGSLFQF